MIDIGVGAGRVNISPKKHLESQVHIGKRHIHESMIRFFSTFVCRLIARRRELEDAQKQFHALASRISGEEQSLDGRGCSRGVLVENCELFSFANIQAKQISQKLSLRLTRRKAWGNVGPTIFYTDIGQERGRRVMSSSGTSHVTELSVFWRFWRFGEPQVFFRLKTPKIATETSTSTESHSPSGRRLKDPICQNKLSFFYPIPSMGRLYIYLHFGWIFDGFSCR